MWPLMIDMTKLECKKKLRTLELDAYASIVSAFRAQGDLTAKKLELLQELQIVLHVTLDRHKAEIRRAINDETLYTIAKRLSSESSNHTVNQRWQLEAKRLIPVLPRLTPNTYYKIIADNIIEKSKHLIESLVEPNETECREKNLNQNQSTSKLTKPVDDPNLIYLNDQLSVFKGDTMIESIKPSELIEKYLQKKSNSACATNESLSKYNNQIIEKLLENKELRERCENELASLKQESSTITTTATATTTTNTPAITVTTITLPNSNGTSTTSITNGVNTTHNQKVILKTVNSSQIKTTNTLKSLVQSVGDASSTSTTSTKMSNESKIKQFIVTKANSKVILVANNNVVTPSLDKPQTIQVLNSTNQLTSTKVPKITTIISNPNMNNGGVNNQSIQKFYFVKASNNSNESKTLKLITSPLTLPNQNNENPTIHNKQVIFNNVNCLKDIKLSSKMNVIEDFKGSNNVNQDNDLCFKNEHDICNLLPSIPPISPSVSSTNLLLQNTIIGTNTQKLTNLSNNVNCFQESFKRELQQQVSNSNENDFSSKKLDLKRKRLNSTDVDDNVLLSPSETQSSSSSSSSNSTGNATCSSSPPNFFETNLNFINEMLKKLNENNFKLNIREKNDNEFIKSSNSSCCSNSNETFQSVLSNNGGGSSGGESMHKFDESNLRILCETVKEKLETNAYQSIDDLNNDMNLIKQEYSINSNKVENESVSSNIKRVKLFNSSLNSAAAAGTSSASLLEFKELQNEIL